jgi:hypothetical protein
MLGTAMD